MAEQTSTRRRVLLIFQGLLIANFLGSLLLWLAGKESSGTDVIFRGLVALVIILLTRKFSRRVALAMWSVFALTIAGLVWHYSAR